VVSKIEVDGATIAIEVSQPSGQTRAGVTEAIAGKWSDASKVITHLASAVHDTVNQIARDIRPEALEIEFGLKFTSEADWIIAKAGGEAHLDVKLTFNSRG
jgi:hypothetical protein